MPTKSTPMSKSSSTQLVKSTAAAAQFQRLVKALAATAPPGHHESTPVATLCSVERSYASGFSQTVSLMQAGEQQFIQTVTGNERFLPPSMRPSQKRGREVDDADEGDEVEAATPKKSKGKSKSATTTPATRRTRRSARDDLTTPVNDGDDEDPSPRASARPKAPRKSRAHRDRHANPLTHGDDEDNMDDDEGNLTETESAIASVLGLGPNVGVRRSTRHRTASEPTGARVVVKNEPSEDDLLSLCGGFECIDVQSSIDAESEYGTPAPPVASTSTLRSGSVRA